MTMNLKTSKFLSAALLAGVTLAATPVTALGVEPVAAPAAAEGEVAKLISMMTGSWKATVGDKQIVMSVAPVTLSEVPDAMYLEIADATAMSNPYRQVILQAYMGGGKLKLRTLQFSRQSGRLGSVVGLWAAPEAFPDVKMSDLVGTLDVELAADGAGFTGKTASPFPTAAGGAMSMTSELSVGKDSLSVADRGFNADGKIVWGPAAGEWYRFAKFDTGVKATRFDGGVVVVDFVSSGLGDPASENQQIVCNYVGYLADGKVFDRSFDRGEPLRFNKGQKLIPGANAAFAELRKGMKRRLVIPAAQAYGSKGRAPNIPADATLYYDIEIIDVATPQAPVVVPTKAPPFATPGLEANAPGKAPK